LDAQAEISNFDVVLCIEQDVAHFEVAVDDVLLVELADCLDHLCEESADFGVFRLVFGHPGLEFAMHAVLQDDLDVAFVLEEVHEFADLGVVQRVLDLDLFAQSHGSGFLLEPLLVDHLHRKCFFIDSVLHFLHE